MISVVSTWDGRKAHALRIALRLTNEAFADHLGVASRAVAKWDAQPDLIPVMSTQQVLDVALERAPDEAKQRFELLLAEVKTEPSSPNVELRITSIPMTVQLPTASPRFATPETLAYLRNTLNSHYTADNLLGPRALLPAISAHVSTIEQLLQGTAGAAYDELLRIGAGYAEFAGWLCQDSGDLSGAAAWCDRALEWAQAGGDERMAAFVMMRRAVQSISAGRGAYAVRLAAAAQRGGDRPETVRVRALAAMTEANGHAISREPSETDRALDVADALLEREAIITDGDPMEGRYCELDLYLKITRAKCHLELGRANDAIDAFGVVLADLPADYHRDRGQYLARLAQAHIMAEQPEPACIAAEESLAIAISTGSGRTIDELRTMTKRLAKWIRQPTVERFLGMLTVVELSNGGAWLVFSIATDAAPGRPNEDFAIASCDIAVVVDGAGIPHGGCQHGVAWYARQLGVQTMASLIEHSSSPLTTGLADGLARVAALHSDTCDLDDPGTPCAAVGILRINADSVDALALSDVSVAIHTIDGPQIICDLAIEELCGTEPEALAGLQFETPEHRAALKKLVECQTETRNKNEGWWVAASLPDAAYHAKTASFPITDVRGLAVLSDGATRPVDQMSVYNWREYLHLLDKVGPQSLIDRVREIELNDPSGTTFPRTKRHDDATIVHFVAENKR